MNQNNNNNEMYQTGKLAFQKGLLPLITLYLLSLGVPDFSNQDQEDFLSGYRDASKNKLGAN
jgi:hypothetical protein